MINPENNTSLPSYPPTEPVLPELEKSLSNVGSLTARTFHGLKWSYLDTVINAVLQIGYTAVMARLLSPADFGLVAMANVVLRFGSYFAQMGMGSALVQKKDLSQEEIRAGFTSNVILSGVMFWIIWLAAPLSIYIFNNDNVGPIVRWLALSFIFTGLSTTALSLLRRTLDFRSIAIIHIISLIFGYAGVGIIMAVNGFGVYSLIGAALSQGAILAILAYFFSRHNLKFIFKWIHYKRLFSFGARVSIISFMEFISSNLDTMTIGRFMGDIALGFYNRAFMLVNLPMQYLVTSFSRVLMPSFSQIQDQTYRIKNAYLSSILLVSSVLIPVSWGISVAAKDIVMVVLGDKWSASIPILQIISLAIPFNLLKHLAAIIFEAVGELNIKIKIELFNIVLLIVLFYILSDFGVIGFAVAVSVSQILVFIIYMILSNRRLHINRMEMFCALKPSLQSTIIICTFIYFFRNFIISNSIPIFVTLFIEILVSGLLLLFLFVFSPSYKPIKQELYRKYINSNNISPISLKNKIVALVLGQK